MCQRAPACGIDHEVDDLLAHAAVLQVQNIGSAQAVGGVRIPNLAQDDFLANAPLGQYFDISHAGRRRLRLRAANHEQSDGHNNCR